MGRRRNYYLLLLFFATETDAGMYPFFSFAKEVSAVENPKVSVLITKQEQQVIELMRQIEYGELVISIKGGSPVRVEEVRKSIQIK